MKRNIKIFFRTMKITALILFCLSIGFFGMAKSYESIRQIGFGEYRKAVEIENGTLKFFDYEVTLN